MSCTEQIASRSTSIDTVRRIGLSWPMLLGATALLAALISGAVRIGPDSYWHIVAGRWILAHGYVPTRDLFSFTMHGSPWVAQEWGAELLMASVYGVAGWSGLVLLAGTLFGLTIAYLARFLLSRMEPLHAMVLTILGGCMMISYILVRPLEFVWPLTAIWLGALIEASENNASPPWWLLGVMLVWANLHASFILGLSLAVAIGAEAIVNAREGRQTVVWRWAAFIAAAFGCALFNPQGWRLLIFPFHVLGMHALSHLSEWQQPNFQHLQVFGIWLAAMLTLAFSGQIRLSLLRSALLVGLTYFALQHARNVSLLGLAAPFLIASPLARLWKERSTPSGDAGVLDRWFRALARPVSLTGLCATAVLAGALGVATVKLRKPEPPAQFTPRAALDALLARRPDARILNDYNFGGYLIFRGIPVFVDGRTDMYGDKFVQSYFNAVELSQKGNIRALLSKYRITAILIGPQWPVVRLLNRLPDWKRVYAGKVAVAYLRRRAVNHERYRRWCGAGSPGCEGHGTGLVGAVSPIFLLRKLSRPCRKV